MGDSTIHVVTTDVEGVKAASSNVTSTTGDTEVIRRDIEQTRAEMTGTIDAIQRKLDPEVLKGQANELKDRAKEKLVAAGERAKERVKEEVREHIADAKHAVHDATVGRVQHMVHRAGHDVREARTTVMDTIRENPIPAAMVATGLAWLLMGGRKQVQTRRAGYVENDYDVYGEYEFGAYGTGYEPAREGRFERAGHRVQDAATHARDAAAATMHDVRDGAADLAHRTRDEAYELAERARREAHELRIRARSGARRAELGMERTFRENPIGLGLAALAIGSLVGAALPRTRREDELLGSARDKLMDKARVAAEEAVEKVKDTADEKLNTFTDRPSLA